ncbi:hypothetical protein FQR65_LT20413 [Abscondita terminalis]|nr:hypothetical protein FQR65_LT20413 [Abscondita terminalis]
MKNTDKKKNYISPSLEVIMVEMESGLAIESAAVIPVQVDGSTSEVTTTWTNEDETTYVSCTESENSLSQGTASVNVNLLGSTFAEDAETDASAKLQSASDKSVQRYYAMADPSTVVISELSSEPQKKNRTASGGVLDAAGDSLVAGTAFRVLLSRVGTTTPASYTYHIHKDYIVGTKGEPLMLDNSKEYTIIAYSFGTSTLPDINSGTEKGPLSSAQAVYDIGNKDFMFKSQVLSFKDPMNVLNITLEHRLPNLCSVKE